MRGTAGYTRYVRVIPLPRPASKICTGQRIFAAVKVQSHPFTASDVLVSILIAPTTFRDALAAILPLFVSGNYAIALTARRLESKICELSKYYRPASIIDINSHIFAKYSYFFIVYYIRITCQISVFVYYIIIQGK